MEENCIRDAVIRLRVCVAHIVVVIAGREEEEEEEEEEGLRPKV